MSTCGQKISMLYPPGITGAGPRMLRSAYARMGPSSRSGRADELCGDPWGLVPEYKRPKVRSARPAVAVKAPPKKRKSVAEMDADGRIVRKFHSICGMAEALNIGNNTAGAWVRSGGIQATGFQYAVCCDDEQG